MRSSFGGTGMEAYGEDCMGPGIEVYID